MPEHGPRRSLRDARRRAAALRRRAAHAPASKVPATMRGACWRAALGLSAAQLLSRSERALSASRAWSASIAMHRPALRPRAGIAHHRRARVLRPQLRHFARHARSAPRQRDADRGRPRNRRARRSGQRCRCASSTSARAPAACCSRSSPSCRTPPASAPTSARRPSMSRARMPSASASPVARIWLAPTRLRASTGPFDILVGQSALRPHRRVRRPRPGGPPLRSASGARRRQRRSTLLPRVSLEELQRSCRTAGSCSRSATTRQTQLRTCSPRGSRAGALQHPDQPGCDGNATLCGCQSTELSICLRKPLDSSASELG